MATQVHILGDSHTSIWHLTGRQRLELSLKRYPGVQVADECNKLDPEDRLVVIRGDHVLDGRLIAALVEGSEHAVLFGSDATPVAARGYGDDADKLISIVSDDEEPSNAFARYTAGEFVAERRTNLRSIAPPRADRIETTNQAELERDLFNGSYKGVTDLITKWLWPAPARAATRICLQLGVNPNAVTLMSLILAVMTAGAFWEGAYITGLIAAWLMTFLDTLDGKLARVSITTSRFGDRLDHGLDLVHPPFWYLAWGLGLGGAWTLTPDFGITITLIFAAYIGGRLCEGAFQLLAPFSLFIWRPFDSLNRLLTARRNPNLILLTGSLIAGRPDLGLWLVMLWHSISTGVLLIRLIWAAWLRLRGQQLAAWLDSVDPEAESKRLLVRLFTQAPTRSS